MTHRQISSREIRDAQNKGVKVVGVKARLPSGKQLHDGIGFSSPNCVSFWTIGKSWKQWMFQFSRIAASTGPAILWLGRRSESQWLCRWLKPFFLEDMFFFFFKLAKAKNVEKNTTLFGSVCMFGCCCHQPPPRWDQSPKPWATFVSGHVCRKSLDQEGYKFEYVYSKIIDTGCVVWM